MILIILFVFAIRTSSFQTYLAKKATAYLSKELGTEINIDQVAIIFLDEVALRQRLLERLATIDEECKLSTDSELSLTAKILKVKGQHTFDIDDRKIFVVRDRENCL